jgi:hypothetical protein
MIDTVNIKVDRPLAAEILRTLDAGKGASRQDDWFFSNTAEIAATGLPSTELWGEHEPSGLCVRGHNGVVEWVQASFPRLLFGDNGQLIRRPEQADDAQQKLKTILNQITTVRRPLYEFVRVDLVLHFRCDISRFIAAHRNCRHPLIRNKTFEYGPKGLKLRGSKCAICFYDKSEQMRLGHGDVLRVEVQLKKPKLGELFGTEGMPLYSLAFSTCYQVYRTVLCALTPVETPKALCFNSLLAHCEAADFRLPNGLTAMENYRGTVKYDTYLNRRRQIKGMSLAVAGIDWSQLLPERRLPEDLPDVLRPTDLVSLN